jgi:hypothetical protein
VAQARFELHDVKKVPVDSSIFLFHAKDAKNIQGRKDFI